MNKDSTVIITMQDELILESLFINGRLRGLELTTKQNNFPNCFVAFDQFENEYFYFTNQIDTENLDAFHEFRKLKPVNKLTLILKENIKKANQYWEQEVFKKQMLYCFSINLQNIKQTVQSKSKIRLASNKERNEILRNYLPDSRVGEVTSKQLENTIEKRSDLECWIASSGPTMAGFAFFIQKGDCIIVNWVYTLPDYRRKSVAVDLIQHSLQDAKKRGLTTSFLIAEEDQSLFFQRIGFCKVETLSCYEFNGWKIDGSRILKDTASYSATLKTAEEYKAIVDLLNLNNIPAHPDLPKNWDSYAALKIVLKLFAYDKINANILDAGGEFYSAILPQLEVFGFKQLYCINLEIKEKIKVGNITYENGDITRSRFCDSKFDAITCLSVIEHGVDLPEFFKEMSRILKPNGILIISTDFWNETIDSPGQIMYGHPVRIFDGKEIQGMVDAADKEELHLIGTLDLTCNERVIHWLGLDYTFIYFTMQKK